MYSGAVAGIWRPGIVVSDLHTFSKATRESKVNIAHLLHMLSQLAHVEDEGYRNPSFELSTSQSRSIECEAEQRNMQHLCSMA